MDPLRLLECWARLEKRIRRGASVAEQDKAFSSQGHVHVFSQVNLEERHWKTGLEWINLGAERPSPGEKRRKKKGAKCP